MWPECQDNYSFQSSVKVKNEWNYNSTVPLCLYGMHMNNCTQNSYVIQMQFCLPHWSLYY